MTNDEVIKKMKALTQQQPDGRYLSATESWNLLLDWLRQPTSLVKAAVKANEPSAFAPPMEKLLSKAKQRCAAGNTQSWVEIDNHSWNQLTTTLRTLQSAMESIANNSCCTPCLEARMVARKALGYE